AKTKSTITLDESINIPLNQLKLSDENVRKTFGKDAVADMAADIRTNGLIQSLSVRPLPAPDGRITHEVQGGGRRFRALQLLVRQKALPDDAPIPCVPNERGVIPQISLAENINREALHPLDEYRAFADMQARGKSEEDISAAFRVSIAVVKQRLRLGSASPVLHKAFLDEKISLRDLMAFCVTDNHERQEQVWKQVKNQTYISTHTIKQMLTENTVAATDKRVTFVGIEVYRAAGGYVEVDLFDQAHEGYLTDVDLLNQLVQAKLDQEADKLKALGWKWAHTGATIPYGETSGCDQLTPENEELTDEQQQRLEALEAERDELHELDDADLTKKQKKRLEVLDADIGAIENRVPVFAEEDMARAGVTVEINGSGGLRIAYGYVKPEDAEAEARENQSSAPSAGGVSAAQEVEDDASAKLPDSLVMDLTEFRTASLQAALANSPDVAFLSVLHAITLSVLYSHGSKSCLQLTVSTSFPNYADGLKDYRPVRDMADLRKAWTAMLPKNGSDLWSALQAMPRPEQMKLLAFAAASSLNVVVQKHDQRVSQVQHSHQLSAALDFDIRTDWKATADNFFKRVTKASILAAVTEARDDQTAELMSHMKKQGMATEAERLIDGTGWLPETFRAETANDQSGGGIDDTGDDGDLPDFLQDGDTPEEVTTNA
ncbi:MAG: ParB/RepB/Spo0J family partition protein, partial [Proteobacteria bacterium]|nr:ParB/RepB/Spo0J family partition protein [Pseudomonadota bacterium]